MARLAAPDNPSRSRMVMRGMVRHCARCGGGDLFSSWFHLRERCPTCGLKFEREEGFWLGGYVINVALGEAGLLILLALLIGMLANGHSIPVWPFVAGGVAIAVGGPMVTFPVSRTVWSAIDQIMRPLTPEELADARATIATATFASPDADDR
jgi:uncharacterized protein (DUF983 family)